MYAVINQILIFSVNIYISRISNNKSFTTSKYNQGIKVHSKYGLILFIEIVNSICFEFPINIISLFLKEKECLANVQ